MSLTETTHAGGFILSEANGNRSRENGTLNSGEDLQAGTVLGRLLTGTVAEDAGNTGDGVVGAVTFGANAEIGVYTLTGKTESADAGTFSVLTPSGNALPDLTVAAAYASSHINLTVADGAADWDIGDIITITVAAGDYTQFDQDGTDGSQIAAGILYAGVDASDADTACVVGARDATVISDELTWPSDITAGEQAIAEAQLEARGIFLR
jgi:hypothetical protein